MKTSIRLRSLLLFFGVCFLLVWVKLFFWQVISSGDLTSKAERQHFYLLDLPAKRGEITFADGSPLVADKVSYLLYADLRKLTADKDKVAKDLADILIDETPMVATNSAVLTAEETMKLRTSTLSELTEKVKARLTLSNAVWVNLAHFISRQTKEKISGLNISGLNLTDEGSRDYPEASMAAHIVGFVGFDRTGNPKGYFGLEGHYERELAGKAGELRMEKDAFGRPIPIGSETRQEKQDGSTLVTTLDRSVQHFVEGALLQGVKDWKASGGTAVVMEASSGAIVAMASLPRYDPRNFPYYPATLYKDPAVSDLFEPGSVMKPMVMAAAINEDAVTPETRCGQCSGPRQIGEYLIHTFNNQYHPNLSMTEVLINSDNTGMVFVSQKLGFEKFYSYLLRFGFGQPTGVDLEGEEAGALRNRSSYYPIDQATMAFGQGIGVNALQMVRAISVIANGGYLVTPHIVSGVVANGEKIPLKWPVRGGVISPATARTLTEMLVRVANESPEHFPKDRIPELVNFRIAAKSGTAQIAVGGKYKSSGTIASVLGFFPAENPRFVVMVKLNEPEVRPWGSDTAGPVFFSIIKELAYYYGISP